MSCYINTYHMGIIDVSNEETEILQDVDVGKLVICHTKSVGLLVSFLHSRLGTSPWLCFLLHLLSDRIGCIATENSTYFPRYALGNFNACLTYKSKERRELQEYKRRHGKRKREPKHRSPRWRRSILQ